MDRIVAYFNSIGLDFWAFLTAAVLLLAATFLLGAAARFIFGKNSALSGAVSSSIGIVFVYALNIVFRSTGQEYAKFIAPLPFVDISGDHLALFNFYSADYTVISAELLSMISLAFLVNVVDRLLPKGKNLFTWILFRVLTVALAQTAYLLTNWLLTSLLPAGILTYAPVILLAILILMLLTGALKFLVGILLSSVDPFIGALYTFFFASVVGRLITKAVLTTAILSLLVLALQHFGIATICIALAALCAYIPFAIVLLIMWYIVSRVF